MFYYKWLLEYENGEIDYPFDIEEGAGFLYDSEYTITYFTSETDFEGIEKVTEEEYNEFKESIKENPVIEPVVQVPLESRIEALETMLLTILS